MVHPLVALVGAELEENLSLRYLAGTLEASGFSTSVIPFNHERHSDRAVQHVLATHPIAVGISVPFQLRARELLQLAGALRAAGYTGHISVGGHFATFEFANILRDFPAIHSVVLHEGETTFREICECVRDGIGIEQIAGVVTRVENGLSVPAKRALGALDDLPLPTRTAQPEEVLGVRCAPILGSRGCYAHCTFCCIHAYTQSAAGPRYRRRSPEHIVREMYAEYVHRGVRLFVFHDDNFLVPSLDANMKRYSHMRELMLDTGMHDIGLVIKCRPHDVHPELLQLMQSMGVIRVYVGIETNSREGIVSLNRGIDAEGNRRALGAFRDSGIYCTFNVLIFDPDATLSGIEQNLEFMDEFSDVPFNFCRAEVYAGTPLKEILEQQGRLMGDYLAWGYQMRDPRMELLFRIVSTAFAQRNFKPDGVANLNMGIRFDAEVLRHHYRERRDPNLNDKLIGLSRATGRDSVENFRRALSFVRQVDPYDHDSVKGFTLELARSVADSDLRFIAEIKAVRGDLIERMARSKRACSDPAGVGSRLDMSAGYTAAMPARAGVL
jgi:anaerobic magnesium-protoporphyrin IX monomethyl ester cyclase